MNIKGILHNEISNSSKMNVEVFWYVSGQKDIFLGYVKIRSV